MTSYVPRLPNELWFNIFDLATVVPGALETTDDDVIAFSRDEYGINTSNCFREAQYTKLALSRVCFTFNQLAEPLLWKYIKIGCGRQVVQLAAIICSATSEGRNPGAWCVRFEMALSGVHIWTNEHTKALKCIMSRLESLVILSTIFCTADPRLFSSAFTRLGHLSGTIRRLELKADYALVHSIAQPLAQTLTTLWIVPSRAARAPTHHLHLPNLSLFVSSFLTFYLFHEFSSMPRLVTRIANCCRDQDAFMKQHGAQLSCTFVPYLHYARNSLISCPNLTEIILNFTGPPHQDVSLFPSVCHHHLKTITIYYPSFLKPGAHHFHGMVDESSFSSLRLRLNEIISGDTFPFLQRVQFMLPVARDDILEPGKRVPLEAVDIWTLWLLKCRAQGITVFASQGVDEWVGNRWRPLTMDIVCRQLEPLYC